MCKSPNLFNTSKRAKGFGLSKLWGTISSLSGCQHPYKHFTPITESGKIITTTTRTTKNWNKKWFHICVARLFGVERHHQCRPATTIRPPPILQKAQEQETELLTLTFYKFKIIKYLTNGSLFIIILINNNRETHIHKKSLKIPCRFKRETFFFVFF